nr:hypothetical protein [Chloroflexota bacterium]
MHRLSFFRNAWLYLRKIAQHPLFVRTLLILPLLWLAGRVPQPVVRIGPPQRVETVNPKMGVHTRLTDEVEEWKIKRTLEMVREMGAPWIVEYFPWGYYEREKGRYDWSHPDLVVNHALAQGLAVLARIDFVPDWARPEQTTPRYLLEEHFADYADFIYAFVGHFSGRIRYIIIWNEPNLSFEWGYRQPDPAAYTRLLQAAYRRAKEADPNVMVLAAGLAPTLAPPGSEWGMDDLEFLQRMYDAGARGYFDGVAVHAYGWTLPPEDPAAPNVINFARAELIHEVMARNGDGDLPCFITEAGWNDHPRWAKAVPPGLRIAYTLRAYEKAQEEWPWCQMVAMWAFRYPRPARNFQDGFTFVTPGFTPKLIYSEVQNYARTGLPGIE